MTNFTHLTEQHMLEFESRLKHIDELLTRAKEGVTGEQEDQAAELKELTSKREKLADQLTEMRLKPGEDWQEKEIEQAGPMGIWDAVALQIENLIERLGK
jgi:hypothetical protein